ncbi:MAG: glycosyltransferase family 2 protein [Candidatus Blackburnbacteria bacterium]|nr:glycosyltransferase family 2 protein [Candidatus Blackburnbacteria bacterium]
MKKSRAKISVVLATFNEEKNIGVCLESIRQLADEIVVVDGSSTDRTREIAKSYGAHVIKVKNYPIFHINKQRALESATSEWILQLDADERVTKELADEILKVVNMSNDEIEAYQKQLENRALFLRHQQILTERDGTIGAKDGEYAAFFLPRLNYFLGGYLRHGGTYPDGVIRLVKRGKAHFPAKSVHEQIVVDGKVGWLGNDLLHLDSPNFKRYLERNSRYVDLIRDEMKQEKVGKNFLQFVNYFLVKPFGWFFLTQFRHKGILDGYRGVVFSFFSALRFPRAYWRYIKES